MALMSDKMSLKSEDTDERTNRLARVRENQRKSRARKQQYIEELEQKVAACNAQAQQREIEHLIAFQKLEAENAKLRSVLYRAGLTPGFLDDLLKDEPHPTAAEKIAIPRLKATASTQLTSSQCGATTNTVKSCSPNPSSTVKSCSSNSSPTVDSVYNVDGPFAQVSNFRSNTCGESSTVTSSESSVATPVDLVATQQQSIPATNQSVKLPPIASLCDCGPPGSTTTWPRSEDPMGTTLCEFAQDLIDQYNSRGVDINIIRQRLWPGFRNGDASGCRVQSNLLFEVLDELSGDGSMPVGT